MNDQAYLINTRSLFLHVLTHGLSVLTHVYGNVTTIDFTYPNEFIETCNEFGLTFNEDCTMIVCDNLELSISTR